MSVTVSVYYNPICLFCSGVTAMFEKPCIGCAKVAQNAKSLFAKSIRNTDPCYLAVQHLRTLPRFALTILYDS